MHLDKDILTELSDPNVNMLRVADFRVFRAPIKDDQIYAKLILRHPESQLVYPQLFYMSYKTAWMMGEELFTCAKLDNPPEPSF